MRQETKQRVQARFAELSAGIIESQKFSLGPVNDQFEREAAVMAGTRFAVSTASGTVALEVAAALAALKSRKGLVVIPDMTVPMVQWSMQRAGHQTHRVDVTEDFLVDGTEIDLVLGKNRDVAAVVVVWTGGIITERGVDLIRRLRSRGVFVIEDASHAHGCAFRGRPAGSFGDVAAFSFYPTKVLHAGEGGVIVFDDETLLEPARQYVNAAKERGGFQVRSDAAYPGRMSDITAALGLAMLEQREAIFAERQAVAKVYRDAGLKTVQDYYRAEGLSCTYYKQTVMLKTGAADVFELRNKGRYTNRTHGPGDAQYGEFGTPMSRLLSRSHANPPIGWTTEEKARVIAEQILASSSDLLA